MVYIDWLIEQLRRGKCLFCTVGVVPAPGTKSLSPSGGRLFDF